MRRHLPRPDFKKSDGRACDLEKMARDYKAGGVYTGENGG